MKNVLTSLLAGTLSLFVISANAASVDLVVDESLTLDAAAITTFNENVTDGMTYDFEFTVDFTFEGAIDTNPPAGSNTATVLDSVTIVNTVTNAVVANVAFNTTDPVPLFSQYLAAGSYQLVLEQNGLIGDVDYYGEFSASTPIPAAAGLFLSGILGVAGFNSRKRRSRIAAAA